MSLLVLLHTDDERPPLQPTSEEGSLLWEVLFESLGFHREADVSGDLQRLCEVLMTPVQRVYDLVRERDGVVAGGTMLDPDKVSAEGLDYLSQYVGARLLPNMDETQRREEIKRPTTWRRGEDETIELVVKRELNGTQWIRIRSRYPEAGRIYIRTLLSETPSPERLKATLLSDAIPAFEVLDYEAITGVTVADVAASTKWTTVADLAATFSTVQILTNVLPDEI